jgi:hypothetical protein
MDENAKKQTALEWVIDVYRSKQIQKPTKLMHFSYSTVGRLSPKVND